MTKAKKEKLAAKKVKLTLIKSLNRRIQNHKDCVRGLGLRKLNSTAVVDAGNPCIQGMITKVNYLLKVEEV